MSHWTCDEVSGVRYDSDTVTANDLTDNNTVSSATGLLNNACDFEASNSEYLSITDASQTGLDITGDLSISSWVKFESKVSTNMHVIASKYAGSAGQRSFIYGLRDNATNDWKLTFWPWNNGESANQFIEVAWNPSLATWYHVVTTFDASASKVEVFIDGSSIGTATGTITDINSGSGPFTLGAFGTGTYLFDGLLDEVGIWSRVLTSTEVATLYNSGTPLPYEEVTPPTPTTTPTSTTMEDDNIVFSLALIVFLLSFLVIGFIMSIFRKRV